MTDDKQGPAARRAQERFGQIQATLIEVDRILHEQPRLHVQAAFLLATDGRDFSNAEAEAVLSTDWSPELTAARNAMRLCKRCRELFANQSDLDAHQCQLDREA